MSREQREAYHQRTLTSIQWKAAEIKRRLDDRYQQAREELGLTHLRDIGFRKYGAYERYRFFECIKCGTTYPMIGGRIRCNGQEITDCLCQESSHAK